MLLFIQPTGVEPINTSLKVPPPKAVTNAKITVPNRSNFLSIADITPEIAKAKVPQTSIIKTASKSFNYSLQLY